MKRIYIVLLSAILLSCENNESVISRIAFILDNNRMLIPGEIKGVDGSFKNVVLWVDTGNPFFFMSEELAINLGMDLPPDSLIPANGKFQIDPPAHVQIGNMTLDFDSVPCYIVFRPKWLFSASQNDANIPSTILMKYDVKFDYAEKTMTIAEPGTIKFNGTKISVLVHQESGITQIDGKLMGDTISFAIDIGASYCFGSTEFLEKTLRHFPELEFSIGTSGYANIWGWLPYENSSTILRVPEINFGNLVLENFGMVIPPDFNDEGLGMMDWYSQKTIKPIDGFLGPNAFLDYCMGIDYTNNAIYFERKRQSSIFDLDIVPLTLKPELDGSYTITGVSVKNNIPLVDNIEPGDVLLQIDNLAVNGKPMGVVIDELRGKPEETKNLVIKRDGELIDVKAEIKRIL